MASASTSGEPSEVLVSSVHDAVANASAASSRWPANVTASARPASCDVRAQRGGIPAVTEDHERHRQSRASALPHDVDGVADALAPGEPGDHHARGGVPVPVERGLDVGRVDPVRDDGEVAGVGEERRGIRTLPFGEEHDAVEPLEVREDRPARRAQLTVRTLRTLEMGVVHHVQGHEVRVDGSAP